MSEIAARLLDLQVEYTEKKARDEGWGPDLSGGRSLESIAADYDDALRAFLATSPSDAVGLSHP